MTDQAIQQWMVSAESSGGKGFWEYEGQFFMLFYNRFKNTPFPDIPDTAFIYMEMNNWKGMSVRCGAWQYLRERGVPKGEV